MCTVVMVAGSLDIFFNFLQEASVNNDLTEEQKRVVGKYTLEGRLNGLGLDSAQRLMLQQTIKQITQEKTKFKSKVEVRSS